MVMILMNAHFSSSRKDCKVWTRRKKWTEYNAVARHASFTQLIASQLYIHVIYYQIFYIYSYIFVCILYFFVFIQNWFLNKIVYSGILMLYCIHHLCHSAKKMNIICVQDGLGNRFVSLIYQRDPLAKKVIARLRLNWTQLNVTLIITLSIAQAWIARILKKIRRLMRSFLMHAYSCTRSHSHNPLIYIYV